MLTHAMWLIVAALAATFVVETAFVYVSTCKRLMAEGLLPADMKLVAYIYGCRSGWLPTLCSIFYAAPSSSENCRASFCSRHEFSATPEVPNGGNRRHSAGRRC